MSYRNFDDRNSTVRWIPRFVRGWLGLEAEYERPEYSRYASDRRRMADEGVSWVPGFVRSWLGLDFTEPKRYGPSEYDDDYETQSVAYRPAPSAPARPAPAARPAAPAAASYSRETSYTPPVAPPAGPMADTAARRASAYGPPPPPAPRVAGERFRVSAGADLPPTNLEGYVQPVGHLLRSYARGALPPQGLEQFTREVRATSTDVWNLYSYWTRFQTEELFRLGRELLDVVAGDETDRAAAGAPGSVRRIRVAMANGEPVGAADVPVPPAVTPAPPPAPPASSAVFSPAVTADDAAVPPAGANPQAAFEERVAEARDEVRADIDAETAGGNDEKK